MPTKVKIEHNKPFKVVISIYYPTIVPFHILGHENAQNMPPYYTVQQGKNTYGSGVTKWPD